MVLFVGGNLYAGPAVGGGVPALCLGGLLLGGAQACLLGARVRRKWTWAGCTLAGATLGWGPGAYLVTEGVANALGLANRMDREWALVLAGVPAGDAFLALLQLPAMWPAPRTRMVVWVLATPLARLAGTGASLLASPVHWDDMPVYWGVAIAAALAGVVYAWRPATGEASTSAPPVAA